MFFKGFILNVTLILFYAASGLAQGYDIVNEEHSVTVEINGIPLKDVKWKEDPALITTGTFITSLKTLSPQKRGYRFSPDIFNFNDFETSSTKIFRAYKYDISDRLKLHLPFKRDALQNVTNDERVTLIDIQYRDSERNDVAYFNGATSYIDFGSDNTDFQELTLSGWINPEKVTGSNSIIGKGEVFSAKIFDGHPQFTTPGIKDHVSEAITIEPNKWVHLAFVFMPNDQLFFYLNGELKDQITASTIANTDHSILIGSNLWGQYYEGYMSDFALWNRALSDDEVHEVFEKGIPISQGQLKSYSLWWWLLLIIPIGILLYFLLSRKKGASLPLTQEGGKKELVLPAFNIRCLGGFVLTDKDGVEITHLLSPKRKELFLLLLLYTIKSGGISSKKMGEILWPNFSSERVKNNRSTQIKELRKTFEGKLPITIVFIEKKWKVIVPEDIKVDVILLKNYIPELFSGNYNTNYDCSYLEISSIVTKGALLPQIDIEWIDSFKAEYESAVLDILTPYLERDNSDCNLVSVCNAILAVDPLYETAVKKKVQLYMKEGKLMTAQKIMENYKKLYEAFYKENYDINLLQS